MSTQAMGLDGLQVWDSERAFAHLQAAGHADSRDASERLLHALGLLPMALDAATVHDEVGRTLIAMVIERDLAATRERGELALFAQLKPFADGRPCLHANDARGARYWVPLDEPVDDECIARALTRLQAHLAKVLVVFPHGALVALMRHRATPAASGVQMKLLSYLPVLNPEAQLRSRRSPAAASPHLRHLEAEAIHILREAVAEAENPVMMYSVGKDSGVMLHLAQKAFYPSRPPFPLLHVDTRWKFQEMYLFRDHVARESGMELLVHTNPEAIARDINPFDHGSALHTDITKTEGLKQALDEHKFDLVFGGARRDEEKSRAKERIFSFRSATHRWDPKQQRPEVWNLYNTARSPGESIRVFPLSNWTELDIWQYVYQEGIPVVPLYLSKVRPVVVRGGMILAVDDSRFRLLPGEVIEDRAIRFRTLGCYPLTGAVESSAASIEEIILELVNARSSERQGRAIDSDASASMEKKKREGYF